MQPFRSFIATATFLMAAPAFAVTLASGVLESTAGSQLVCQITNLGTTTLSAEAYLLRSTDGVQLAFGGSCGSGQIAPGSTCDLYSQGVGAVRLLQGDRPGEQVPRLTPGRERQWCRHQQPAAHEVSSRSLPRSTRRNTHGLKHVQPGLERLPGRNTFRKETWS